MLGRIKRMPRISSSLLPCIVLLTACTATPAPLVPSVEDDATLAHAVVPVHVAAYTTSELLAEMERARAHLLVDRYDEAAKGFDRVLRKAGDPELLALATYESGLAHEGLGERDVALSRYRKVADSFASQPIARNALVRISRLLGYLEKWDALGRIADTLLKREDLPEMDRIEAWGASALALVQQGDVKKARIAIGKAQRIIDKHGFGRAGAPPVQLAQVAFAEGELRRVASEKIKLTPVATNFGAVLEARCQGLLDAQSAYTEAMRSRDAHWSGMSGYRVGQLYLQLHREAMEIPPPEGVNLKQQQLFEGAMRLRYRILLEKGLKMMRGTVRLGERTGESSFWITRARDAQRALEQALADEKAAMKKLPYAEDEIRAALELLRKPSTAPAKAKP
jgi:tetratricopeptide (TPR) repeat protein